MTAPRTRKTAPKTAKDPEVNSAASAPAPPSTAPLEPPQVHEVPTPPAPTRYAAPTEVIPDDAALSDVIVDDATGEPPTHLDEVFEPLTPFGSTQRCTIRLVERAYLGPHRNPVTRLLQPAGAVLSESVAARIRDRLTAQVAHTGNK
ncbi:hypothetical protein ACWD4V_00865 [Streptomyces tsukubensis]